MRSKGRYLPSSVAWVAPVKRGKMDGKLACIQWQNVALECAVERQLWTITELEGVVRVMRRGGGDEVSKLLGVFYGDFWRK